MTTHIRIFAPNGTDISDEINLRDGKSNPFGWSQHQIYWVRNVGEIEVAERIGSVDSGDFQFNEGFTYTKTEEL